MIRSKMLLVGFLAVTAFSGLSRAQAAVAELAPIADTFINGGSSEANAGGTAWFDAGRDGVNGIRRGLLQFDLGAIPPGSVINSATLRLRVVKVPGFGQAADSSFSLYRLNSAWGEGNKSGNNGATGTAGEATWNERMKGTAAWIDPGAAADAAAAPSATVAVGGTANVAYSWTGQQMAEDVQAWVDNPSANFGWLMRSESEGTSRSVRGFASREAAANRPILEVDYTPLEVTNQPPVVMITSPTNGAYFATTASITIEAEANDADGTISQVEFFNGTNSLGMAANAPYSITITLPAGSHSLLAVATDDDGESTTSAAINIGVGGTVIEDPIAERIPKGDITVELQTVADGMASPVGMAAPNDGSGRMFVYDQNGVVHVVSQGGRLPMPLLDIRDRLVLLGAYDERGLLGFALHPDFPTTPLVYTYTSEPTNAVADFTTEVLNNHQSVIAEWRISAADSNRVDLASRREILRIDQPQSNHNGGAMHFGPDGFLYIALGDGGAANDNGAGHVPGGNAQDKNRIWGSLLRIDLNGSNGINGQYGIPNDNPFVEADGIDEIYAYGLRNPFSFSFDRQTGTLYMPDVGQNRVEEVNVISKGANYGWNLREGTFWFDPSNGTLVTEPVRPVPGDLVDPIAQYDHDDGFAVIGGFVYRGTNLPALSGKYILGDWGSFGAPSGRLFYLDETNGVRELRIGSDDRRLGLWLKGFGEGPDGELYVFGNRLLGPSGMTGRMLKIVPEAPEILATTMLAGTNINVTWTGGAGPFVVQRTTSLQDATWADRAVSVSDPLSFPVNRSSEFFRIAEARSIPPIPFTVHLSGRSEHPANDSTAEGGGILSLDGNTLTFSIDYKGLSGVAIGGHIHGPVDTSTNAPVLIDLAAYNGGAWGTSGTIAGVLVLTDQEKAHLLAGKTYVNLHTPNFTGGEIRGQVAPVNFHTVLSGENEIPRVSTDGMGLGNLLLVGNQLSFVITYGGLTGAASGAHIHGPAGETENNSVMIDLGPFNGGSFGSSGQLFGTVTLTPDQLAAVVDGRTYVNVHTPMNEAGEIRGQILRKPTAVPFTALMSGLAARPTPLTNSAVGAGVFSLEGDTLTFNVTYGGLSGVPTMAHIHGPGNTTLTAPVMIDLRPFSTGSFGIAGALSGQVALTSEQKNALMSGQTYVNFHTPDKPTGELRGQIAPVLYMAHLSGNNERPAVSSPGSGLGLFALVADQLAANITYRDLPSPATAAHIHGPAGFTGTADVLVNLAPLNGEGYAPSGSLSGSTALPFDALLHLIDGQTYVNVHTTNNPTGEIRGHVMK